ncbi:GNAT family N-acetyltransferase [Acidobacteria bacterium AB60]|nr:GNAT family N-acetyltransferase [Acidobacteria bacterium AB60]
MIEVRPITLPVPGIEELRQEALSEGYRFLDQLVEDWRAGINRFDAPGEIFCGCYGPDLVGVGGLNRDPHIDDPSVGRIRRVYIRQGWRNRGIGRSLVLSLLAMARANFRIVRLRAENAGAARLYERLGFVPIDDPGATHLIQLEQPSTSLR